MMDPVTIEKKWQERWAQTELYKFDETKDNKLYVMEMFSYPSGAKLHVGHWYNYGPTDTYARFKRMCGYNVFHPMGFDAFGLPAENYAIKTGIHPQDSTLSNIATMEKQLREMGATFDWDHEVVTCLPDYYRWTQWCFLQLYKHGLAYRKNMPVNWCPSCNTTLANEQVQEGCCERCGTLVTRKQLTQWNFKITEYAEELLGALDTIDWPEKTKAMQRHWIGKSTGGNITFDVAGMDEKFTVFTTRADTLFGCTYVVIAPEHPLVDKLITPEQKAAVDAYRETAARASEMDRLSTTREKTGVFTGSYAITPINGRKVPIYAADYVIASYGTGVVMAVPAHDERDFEFATKFGMPIERVIKAAHGEDDTLPFCEYGVLINSGEFDGLSSEDAITAILDKLNAQGRGEKTVNYRLRDWLISRQRYWGAPIPMIHCEHCGIVPVPEADLPVLLPYNVDFTPDGTSPLLKSEEFINVKCPVCGAPAKRDPDTMDTFVCSSWYFLRYADNKIDKEAWNREKIDKLLPVEVYVGGMEHACMHLLYARFFVKAFRDMGYLDFDEPFKRLVHQGVILGSDGNKMSKSLGNTVSPDDYISRYGSDTFMMYLMFGFSYVDGGSWNDDGIKAINRFLERVSRLCEYTQTLKKSGEGEYGAMEKELAFALNNTIKSVGTDVERFQFNTAIARLMELVNALNKYKDNGGVNNTLFIDTVYTLLRLLAPFAPHCTEQMWEELGQPYSIHDQKWPDYDESALVQDTIEYGIQVNGRIRTRLEVSADTDKAALESLVRESKQVTPYLEGKAIRKVIIVKNIVNIVVG
jgi:leucyl-tRNA synthetase